MIISTTGAIFGALVALAFICFYLAAPDGEGTPRPTITNITALFLGAAAVGVACAMFWTLLDAPVVWP